MLQQTQVARVEPKFNAFMARFPTVKACASSGVADVVRMWAGLGYNRRAVSLHRTATIVIDRHDGALPDTLDDLLALPGIGPYTARAVLVFAFERDVGVLDTNAARVLARTGGRPLGLRDAQLAADALVPALKGWAWNQAMLDLGATICTARSPACPTCPLAKRCAWHSAGAPLPDPASGSAGVSTKQSTFEGSDRQGRGRLVDALRTHGEVSLDELALRAGWPDDGPRAHRAAASLVRDGLAEWRDTKLTLPTSNL